MAISVVMPELGRAPENGRVLGWRKKEGERRAQSEALPEIKTEKAVVEGEAPGDGILAGMTGDVGAMIPGGQTIAWLVGPGEKPPVKSAAAAAPAVGARGLSGQERTTASVAPIAAQ